MHCCPALSTTVKRKNPTRTALYCPGVHGVPGRFPSLGMRWTEWAIAPRSLPDRLRCASVNGESRRRAWPASTPVWRPSRGACPACGIRHCGCLGVLPRGDNRASNRCWRVRMKSVSRAAQGRAGRPAVGVPVSSATGGKAGPMRVAACALAITAAIAASPAHAQYYSVDDGGTPGGIARITARPAPAPGRRDGCDLERACGDGGGIQRAGIGRLHHRHRRACAGDWRE